MSEFFYYCAGALLSLGILYGIHLMSSPKTAVKGNAAGAVCMAAGIVLTLVYDGTIGLTELWLAMLVGSALGWIMARRVKMIQMPQMVALLNGFGGAASAFVAMLVLMSTGAPDLFSRSTGALALIVGMITLTGSLVAAGKLHQILAQRPVVLPAHTAINGAVLLVMTMITLVICIDTSAVQIAAPFFLFIISGLFGVLFTIRVGGADMPVTISLLNSCSGVAGAVAGLAVSNPLLVAVGGIVGASGLLLTQIMCRAMNRSLFDILLGKTSVGGMSLPKRSSASHSVPAADSPDQASIAPASGPSGNAGTPPASRDSILAAMLGGAKKVLIVPGYGMALAQAQHKVKALADTLESKGTDVAYAVHPVAGRMPGHMNVLLAEAGVAYEKLLEMDEANKLFASTDLVLVVGANDVVNPAANKAEGTPIYGMPILNVEEAGNIIICNFDKRPGYAGVDNPLYEKDGVAMLLGDANASLDTLLTAAAADPASLESPAIGGNVSKMLAEAKSILIVPGYGMALAQAQHKVKALADTLTAGGANVAYAIHPVAGRMPGHMNVLLAEADVDYETLLEMDEANKRFYDTDLAIIVGANDVVNPAANKAEGTPIYGMPILNVDEARNIIICNFDKKPGYAGVDNPLYEAEDVVMLTGDANASVEMLQSLVKSASGTAERAKASPSNGVGKILGDAKSVLIVPGYGMALAQAQHKVKSLADALAGKGADVAYAIHPVAGRMPGHMNVLLAEADVDYDTLLEMDVANPRFGHTDLVVVVGANDVVNPAANKAEGTPIYGMPILNVDEARNIIICNYDTQPGYAGVDNPLYERKGVVLMTGDAKSSVDQLLSTLH